MAKSSISSYRPSTSTSYSSRSSGYSSSKSGSSSSKSSASSSKATTYSPSVSSSYYTSASYNYINQNSSSVTKTSSSSSSNKASSNKSSTNTKSASTTKAVTYSPSVTSSYYSNQSKSYVNQSSKKEEPSKSSAKKGMASTDTKSEKTNKGMAPAKSADTKAKTYSPSVTSPNIQTVSMNFVNQSSKNQPQPAKNSSTNKPSANAKPPKSTPKENIKESMSTSTSQSYSPSVSSSNAGNQSMSFMNQVSSYTTEAIGNSAENNQAVKAIITTAIIAAVDTIGVKDTKNSEKKDTPQIITSGNYSPSQYDPNQSLSYFEQNTYNARTPINEKQRYYNTDKNVVKDYSWNHINNLVNYQKEKSEKSKKVKGNNNKLFTWNLKKQIDNIHRNDNINNKVKMYTNYWNRTDGYFNGFWWQDNTKINEAISMLELEIDVKGSISITKLDREQEMLAIQELANAERTHYYDEGTLAALENNLTVKGLDYTEKNHSIDKETLEALKERHDKVIFNKAGDVLEGGLGDVISGLSLLGLGAVATISNNSKTSGNGNIEKTNSTEKNTTQAAEEPVNTEIKTEDDIINGNVKSADNVIEGGSKTINTLTDAQKSRLNSLENTINDHLTEGDFSGTLRDLQGNPVPNGKGGYFDHLGEMRDSYAALSKIKKGLEGSLKNPILSDIDRTLLQEGLDNANSNISRIEDMFEPFGGIN